MRRNGLLTSYFKKLKEMSSISNMLTISVVEVKVVHFYLHISHIKNVTGCGLQGEKSWRRQLFILLILP